MVYEKKKLIKLRYENINSQVGRFIIEELSKGEKSQDELREDYVKKCSKGELQYNSLHNAISNYILAFLDLNYIKFRERDRIKPNKYHPKEKAYFLNKNFRDKIMQIQNLINEINEGVKDDGGF